MIDEKMLFNRETTAREIGHTLDAEIIRLARRYLALRKEFAPFGMDFGGKHSWCWCGSPSHLIGETIDAATDRLLEGGK